MLFNTFYLMISSAEILQLTITEALKATCQRSKCGSIILNREEVIGRGFNSPPNNLESQRRCHRKDELKPGFKSDRTCCTHAEQRAIMDALQHHPDQLAGAHLYFIRLDNHDQPKPSGQPYCTICSKMALDTGLATFSLWNGKTWDTWPTEEYNDLSFAFNG
jgi:hypothetical protein